MMKFTKILVVVTAALGLMTFAGTASATTLATKGAATNASEAVKATVAAGASLLMTDTFGTAYNTCSTSTIEWRTTSPFTVADPGKVAGPVEVVSWSNCTEGNPTVDLKGSLLVQHVVGTTNGTVVSNGTKITMPSLFGNLTCTTENTDLGTLNGKKEGSATLTINAVVACTVLGTTRWSGTYTITSPSNLGIEA
jgi:hypothetical protein